MENNQTRILTETEIDAMNGIKWFHRIHLGEDENGIPIYTPGVCHHGVDGEDYFSHRFGIPADLSGKTVLDIGGWDGVFSFEAERRGAKQVTIWEASSEDGGNWGGGEGYRFAKQILQSDCNYEEYPVKKITGKEGQFDYVFFFGVFYHLVNPFGVIEKLLELVKPGGQLLLETAIADQPELRSETLIVYQGGYHNDPTNYWYPTVSFLTKIIEDAGATYRVLHSYGSCRVSIVIDKK